MFDKAGRRQMPVRVVGSSMRRKRYGVVTIGAIGAGEMLFERIEQDQASLFGPSVGLLMEQIEEDGLGFAKPDPGIRRTEGRKASGGLHLSVEKPVERAAQVSETEQRSVLARLQACLFDDPAQSRRIDRFVPGSRGRT